MIDDIINDLHAIEDYVNVIRKAIDAKNYDSARSECEALFIYVNAALRYAIGDLTDEL